MDSKILCLKHSFVFAVLFGMVACSGGATKTNGVDKGKTVADVIPITMANMRGHKALYEEGWFVVTSSEKALAYAKEKSVVSSRQAILSTISSISSRNKEFAESLSLDVKQSIDLSISTFETGTRVTSDLLSATNRIGQLQIDYGTSTMAKAWDSLIKGNLYLGKRTQDTRDQLSNQPGEYFSNLKSDFSNIYDLTSDMNINFSKRIGETWSGAFSKASQSFVDEYEASGKADNSIVGLFHIIQGYLKGLYQGLVKPVATTTVDSISAGARGVAQVVFLPAATVTSVAGRTIQAIGSTVYYSGKLGIEVISPTIEAGLLSGLSILSLGTVPLTYVTGASIGAVNQVAFTAATPVVGAANAAVKTAVDTGKYVAFVSYDAVVGTTKVVINQASSAVVLGYNALTALPSHLLMGTIDGAVFLAWDGPRLIIAKANGEIGKSDNKQRVDSLPVGSVVNLKDLQDQGVTVEVVSEDPVVIKDVLEGLSGDLRE